MQDFNVSQRQNKFKPFSSDSTANHKYIIFEAIKKPLNQLWPFFWLDFEISEILMMDFSHCKQKSSSMQYPDAFTDLANHDTFAAILQ